MSLLTSFSANLHLDVCWDEDQNKTPKLCGQSFLFIRGSMEFLIIQETLPTKTAYLVSQKSVSDGQRDVRSSAASELMLRLIVLANRDVKVLVEAPASNRTEVLFTCLWREEKVYRSWLRPSQSEERTSYFFRKNSLRCMYRELSGVGDRHPSADERSMYPT